MEGILIRFQVPFHLYEPQVSQRILSNDNKNSRMCRRVSFSVPFSQSKASQIKPREFVGLLTVYRNLSETGPAAFLDYELNEQP